MGDKILENKNISEADFKQLSRQERGKLIAQKYRITKTDKGYLVPSQFNKGKYLVEITATSEKCNCPDFELRKCKCKHIFAVEYTLRQEIDDEGNLAITETVNKTYKQKWDAYNTAQCNEQKLFMKLLADLVKNVEQPEYKFGRPSLPLSDMIFSSALKVYSTFSLRRFMGLVDLALEKKYIDIPCSYVLISNIMRKKELTPILHKLIQITSLPLATIEKKFAIDSSRFSTCRFARYYSFKHGKDMRYRTWLKAHLISGTKTNIVTCVELSDEYEHDSPRFKPLVEKTAREFRIEEVSGDMAYSSRNNLDLVKSLGGTAYIPFKSNTTGKARGSMTWTKMYHYFMANNEEFLQHYHLRSNSETVFHMIKSKFRDNIRSKDRDPNKTKFF